MNKVKGILNKVKEFFVKLVKPIKLKKPPILGKLKIKGNTAGIILVVLTLVLGVLYYFRGLVIAATVNGQPVSRLKIIETLEKTSGKAALDNAITEVLVLQEAKKLNKLATNPDVDKEVDSVRTQLKDSGQTLEQLLTYQGVTMDQFRKQLMLQKTVENILSDKLTVSQAEIDKFIEDNKAAIPDGMAQEELIKIAQQQVKSQKMATEFQNWLDMVKTKSDINLLVKY